MTSPIIGRREFITLLGGGVVAWPMAVSAQQSRTVKRIAILVDGGENSGDSIAAFPWLQSLEGFGWSEGRNLQSTTRFGNGRADRIQAVATELIRMNPDLILVSGATGVVALLRETQSIPILFVFPGDPVAIGLVGSMARPAGNATGFTGFETGKMVTKGLQLIKEFAPGITRLLVLHGGNASSPVALTALERVVGLFGVEMTSTRVSDQGEIEHAIETAARTQNVGMMVLGGSFVSVHRNLIVALAARHRLPAIYYSRDFVAAGGLLSYGIDPIELHRQAVSYVDRILRGEKPANLPVQAATKFELAINAKTAKALELTVPPNLLALADEVIE
jgi:putative tryptophan/tyrosine transport system substrate-binding protein